ncbi:MAG: hypothetical protein EBR02_04250 [Alphaproteobacteria bacterium]|nr:hypothetical protein [Alphaproteobacteria bacterium]
MDSEEEQKLEKASFQQQMAAETDNRLHAFWETYKGGVKGKLGGFVLGAIVGAVLGIPAALILAGSLPALGFTGIVAAFSGAGMLYAAHDFDQVGKISGGIAAGLQTTEGRLKKFMGKELAEIKDEIKDIKKQVGVPEKTTASSSETPEEKEVYRTKHLLDRHKNQPFYPKLAIIGLAVGAAVGALLAGSDLGIDLLKHIGIETAKNTALAYTASISVMATFGASFGINRDYFRAVFDKTDKWFKGVSYAEKDTTQEPRLEQQLAPVVKSSAHDISTAVLYSNNVPERSGTYHRDHLSASRAKILLGFDPGATRPH